MVPTYATWLRNYVESHPDYNDDSVITEEMGYDISNITTEVTKGNISTKKFYWQTILEKKQKAKQLKEQEKLKEQESLELEA